MWSVSMKRLHALTMARGQVVTTLENYADINYIIDIVKIGLITKGGQYNGEE